MPGMTRRGSYAKTPFKHNTLLDLLLHGLLFLTATHAITHCERKPYRCPGLLVAL